MPHTPGPWHVAGATVYSGHRIRPENAEANARLIAAAPDLLAACKTALARHKQALKIRKALTGREDGGIANEIAQLEAAIAKAEA